VHRWLPTHHPTEIKTPNALWWKPEISEIKINKTQLNKITVFLLLQSNFTFFSIAKDEIPIKTILYFKTLFFIIN
jgi:hypothetical protein